MRERGGRERARERERKSERDWKDEFSRKGNQSCIM